MVKKLFRYEIAAWLKTMLPIELIVLGTACVNRIMQLFEVESTVFDVVFTSSVILLCVTIFVSCIAVFVLAIKRFHNNLFSFEGYLTMSLPITAEQHIIVKLLTTLLFDVITRICAFLAFAIVTSGDAFVECMKAFGYLFNKFNEALENNLGWFTIEAFFAILFLSIKGILLFYLCISLGQTARKNRVAASVGIFFGYYFLMQILGTIFSVFLFIAMENGTFEELLGKIFENPIPYCHAFFIFIVVWNLLFAGLYFFLNRQLITKKLNLE